MKDHQDRISVALILLQLVFGVMIVRLIYVQFLIGDQLRERSARQFGSQDPNLPRRGQIVDRNYRTLAINRDLIQVNADPKTLSKKNEPDLLASQLAKILPISESNLEKDLRSEKRFVRLYPDLGYDKLKKIKDTKKKYHGLLYEVRGDRIYLQDRLACHVVGTTNFANDGIDGIEKFYETELRTSQSGIDLPNREMRIGNTVVLTIDQFVQHIAEKAIADGCRKWGAKRGVAIVMHTKTGEILAMANYPSYDPNFYSSTPEKSKRNSAIWMEYEPGSTFKIVTASITIDKNLLTPFSIFNCENGKYTLSNGHTIRDVKPNGDLTLGEILQKSSNIGIMKASRVLTKDHFLDYAKRFGFGEKTGIDLPSENDGSLRGMEIWDDFSSATVPFGQGISATPIQMLSALNVIANGGVRIQPRIVREIRSNDGELIKLFSPKAIRKVIRPKTARVMTQMLVDVVELGGGFRAKVDGYTVAGKTGTSQKAISGRGYIDGKEINTFVGFLPAEEPQISILVVLDEPSGAPISGRSTAPIFKKIATQTMRYLNQTELFAKR